MMNSKPASKMVLLKAVLPGLAIFIFHSAQAMELKLLSWNVFMLPKPIKYSLQTPRAKIIASQLAGSDYDFMFFQEAFTAKIRGALKKKLGLEYPYQYYLKRDDKLKHVFGSGVFTMARHPFKVLDRVYFKTCGAFDCYAAKGSVLIEATLPDGKVVQFAPTHLQAKEALGHVRLSQLRQVRAMLKKHARIGVPQIIMGDLNIDVAEPEFEKGLELMGMTAIPLVGPIRNTNGLQNDCYQSPGKNKEWVDHFWIGSDSETAQAEMQVRKLEFEHRGRICPLSDHHAVEASILF